MAYYDLVAAGLHAADLQRGLAISLVVDCLDVLLWSREDAVETPLDLSFISMSGLSAVFPGASRVDVLLNLDEVDQVLVNKVDRPLLLLALGTVFVHEVDVHDVICLLGGIVTAVGVLLVCLGFNVNSPVTALDVQV